MRLPAFAAIIQHGCLLGFKVTNLETDELREQIVEDRDKGSRDDLRQSRADSA